MRELDGKLWSTDGHGYWATKVDGKAVSQHRYVWEKANGPIPAGMQIDHINGDRRDNRLSNLRVVTHQENSKNVKRRKDNKSGVTGVGWHKKVGKWQVQIQADGKYMRIGYFDDWFEAVCARLSANNLYGYHPNHGRR
jgi:hypothetical protein